MTDRRSQEDIEVSWIDIMRTMRRWQRFILRSLLGIWAVVLAVWLLTPPLFGCQATLAMPNVAPAAIFDGPKLPLSDFAPVLVEPAPAGSGLPLVAYKRLRPALGDTSMVAALLNGRLDPGRVQEFSRRLTNHVIPVISGPERDLSRLEKDESVTAVTIFYESRRRGEAQAVVTMLAQLIRDVVAHNVVLDFLSFQRAASASAVSRAKRLETYLSSANSSLDGLGQDLDRLQREIAIPPGAREVVQVDGGGYRYLPLPVQLVGARAAQAAGTHTIRMLRRESAMNAARLDLINRVEQRLVVERRKGLFPAPWLILGEELTGMVRDGRFTLEMPDLQAEVAVAVQRFAGLANEMRLLQTPTTEARSELLLFAVAGVLASALAVGVPLANAVWARHLTDPQAPRTEP